MSSCSSSESSVVTKNEDTKIFDEFDELVGFAFELSKKEEAQILDDFDELVGFVIELSKKDVKLISEPTPDNFIKPVTESVDDDNDTLEKKVESVDDDNDTLEKKVESVDDDNDTFEEIVESVDDATNDAAVESVNDADIPPKELEFLKRYRALAIERGGRLLSTRYRGCRYKLRWQCAEGHEWLALPSNIRHGTWCPPCGWKGSGAKRMANNLIRGRAVAESLGGKCLAEKNGSATCYVWWECVEGHRWQAMFQNVILKGTWCSTCRNRYKTQPLLLDNLTTARQLAAKNSGECLETENFSIHDYVRWRCQKGHEWDAVFYSVRRGSWCQTCSNKAMGVGKTMDNLTRAREIAASRDGECLAQGNFTVSTKVLWKCEKGHEWEAHLSNIMMGTWCPQCRNKSESYCHKVLCALFPRHVFRRNVRDLEWMALGVKGRTLEVDIFCDGLGFGLEFNGFLHDVAVEAFGGEEQYNKIVEHDRRKAEACEKAGVCLIVIRFADISYNNYRIDPKLAAIVIWHEVLKLGFPTGTHLETLSELLDTLKLQ
jgi:Probable Zinc-ribbon domain